MFDEPKPGEHEITSELAALEQHLRGLTPATPRIDRDRLMFEAGRVAGLAGAAEPGRDGRAIYDRDGRPLHIAGPSWAARRFWPAATFTMTAATLLLATMLVWQNRPQSFVQPNSTQADVVEVLDTPQGGDVQPADRFVAHDLWSVKPSSKNGYLGVRYVALTEGISALPIDTDSTVGDRDVKGKNQRAKPATVRNLMNELLPAPAPPNPSRS